MPEMEFHEAANIFPMMPHEEQLKLSDDIKTNGLMVPVELLGGKVIDGRNRWLACKIAQIEPETVTVDHVVDDPVSYVLSLNLHRRHLNESQRAMVAAKVEEQYAKETNKGGRPKLTKPVTNLSQVNGKAREKAGEALSVSGASVQTAKSVIANGSKKLVEAVESGAIPVSRAKAIIEATDGNKQQQNEAAKKVASGEKASKVYRDIVHENRPHVEPPKGKYQLILADPPWQYGDERGTVAAGGAAATYPTMPLDDICELPIKELATKDSVLFLWATVPLLSEAMKVVEAWGFKYKTHIVWDKLNPFYGNYTQVQHELLIIAVRGSCVPTGKPLPRSIIAEKKGKHSAKPDVFHETIERMYPKAKRIELFARATRKGWKQWGNE